MLTLFLKEVEKQNADLKGEVQVIVLSLGEVFKLAEENFNQPDGLKFIFTPTSTQVEQAKKILSESDKEYKGGVPLFFAKGNGAEGGHLMIQKDDQELMPFFFEKKQVDDLILNLKENQSEIASEVVIDVIPLEYLLSILKEKDDDGLKKVHIDPSKESIEFLEDEAKKNEGK